MILASLTIQNLRNIHSAQLELHPHINFIRGMNGSGKTSLLEALYLLGNGRSFRAREISALITHEEEQLNIFARTVDDQTISIQKSMNKPTLAKINGNLCQGSSELAGFLPTQIFYHDLFLIIDAGPMHRRILLDWGLFHVEHHYFSLWKDYGRALKQRNALIKQRANQNLLVPWNQMLSDLANKLDAARFQYCQDLNKAFLPILSALSEVQCVLTYYKGWDRKREGKSLEAILYESYEKDILRQFTHYGAHQADIIVESEDYKAKNYLSRGQQKIILFALKLAQTTFLKEPCLFLIDDMFSELDEKHSQRLLDLFYKTKGQFFITSQLNVPFQSNNISQLHNLEQGRILYS